MLAKEQRFIERFSAHAAKAAQVTLIASFAFLCYVLITFGPMLRDDGVMVMNDSGEQAPHFYVRGTARVDRLLALRQELNDEIPAIADVFRFFAGAARTMQSQAAEAMIDSGLATPEEAPSLVAYLAGRSLASHAC